MSGHLGFDPLGNIEVNSALNEPFRARIPVRGARPGELEELRARLGDDSQFARAGLDRAFVLTRIRFNTVALSSSSGYVELSTKEPLAEPFLNFLIDLSWSKGRVLREYTVLLDPPVYGAAISSGSRSVETVDTPRRYISSASRSVKVSIVSEGTRTVVPRVAE